MRAIIFYSHNLTTSCNLRHHRPCRSWEVNSSEGHIRGYDGPIQERTRSEYYHQARVCQCKGSFPYCIRSPGFHILNHPRSIQIYKCENEACPRPGCYRSFRSDKEDNPACERPGCGHRMKLIRHVSFVDCPGHDILMATMLNGAAVMDAALLLIAGNETCPQPQTSEHLAAVEIMKLENIIILQNKVDLIKEAQALEHQKSITAFVKGIISSDSCISNHTLILHYRNSCRIISYRPDLCPTKIQY